MTSDNRLSYDDRKATMPAAPAKDEEEKRPTYTGLFEYPEGYLANLLRFSVDSEGNRQSEPGRMIYDEESAFMLLSDMDPDTMDRFLMQLWWAGFGPEMPDGSDISRETLQGVAEAMDRANLNGGHDVVDYIYQRSELAKLRGARMGTEVDIEEQPAFKLQQLASANGVKLNSDFIARSHDLIMNEQSTLDAEMQRIRDNLIAPMFPAFAEQIKMGMDVTDLSQSYRTTVENMLELPSGTVGLDNPYVQQAMQGKEPTPLWELEDQLRDDPEYEYTDRAHQEVGQLMSNAFSIMGLEM